MVAQLIKETWILFQLQQRTYLMEYQRVKFDIDTLLIQDVKPIFQYIPRKYGRIIIPLYINQDRDLVATFTSIFQLESNPIVCQRHLEFHDKFISFQESIKLPSLTEEKAVVEYVAELQSLLQVECDRITIEDMNRMEFVNGFVSFIIENHIFKVIDRAEDNKYVMLQTIDKTKPISIIHVKFPAGIYMDVTEIQVTNIEKNLKAILLKDHDPNMLLSNKNTYSIKHNLRIDENLVNLNNILTKLVNSN